MPLILLLIAAALVVKFAWLIAAVLVTVVIAVSIGKASAWLDDLMVARRRRDAEIAARADRQHAAVLAGDYRLGVYGDYPPCTS
jgi:hypothetical protein